MSERASRGVNELAAAPRSLDVSATVKRPRRPSIAVSAEELSYYRDMNGRVRVLI